MNIVDDFYVKLGLNLNVFETVGVSNVVRFPFLSVEFIN